MKFRELAFGRRSIRKFKNIDISLHEIEELVNIATSAPSGCNSQCWKFIAIKNKDIINQIDKEIYNKIEDTLSVKKDNLLLDYLKIKRKMSSFFSEAPVVIAVFLTEFVYYDKVMISALKEKGYSDAKIMEMFSYPDILSVGAAIQNLLLAIHEKGYGACWMNDPAIAGEEIKKIIGLQENAKFISLIPVGMPSYNPRNKKMKDLKEVYSVML